MKAKRGLGRGLGALIPGGGSDEAGSESQKTVRIDLVRANPHQPRKHFNEDELDELTESIKSVGVIQPILVRERGDGYEIISGERRWRAAQRVGLTEIPVVLREATDREVLRLALIENLQRVDLNPLEEAEGYQKLLDDFGLTQEEVASHVGKDRSTVTNLLRLLKLAAPVQDMVREGKLSMGHGRALAAIAELPRQVAAARQAVEKGLSVRQVEALVREAEEGKPRKQGARPPADPNLRSLIDKLRKNYGTKVLLAGKPGRGKLVFEYYSEEEFERLLERLLK